MRTIQIIVGGLLLWTAAALIIRLASGRNASRQRVVAMAFVVIWFVVATTNMWIGINHAGYSFREELPVFVAIFLLPAAVAVVASRRFFG